MKLVTKQDRIKGVAAAWAEQYSLYLRQKATGWKEKKAILDDLRALPATATEDDIARIIGNRSWTELSCDECEQSVEAVIEIGRDDEVGYGAKVCADCLSRGLALFTEAING